MQEQTAGDDARALLVVNLIRVYFSILDRADQLVLLNQKRTRTVNHHQERIRAVVCRRHLRAKRAKTIVARVQEGPEA